MWGWRWCSVTVRYGAPRCNTENFTVCRICVTCSTLSAGFSKMGLEQCLRSVFPLYWRCDYPTLHEDGEDRDLGSVQVSLPWSFIDAAEDVECLDQDKGLWFLPQGKTCAICWQVPFVPCNTQFCVTLSVPFTRHCTVHESGKGLEIERTHKETWVIHKEISGMPVYSDFWKSLST